MSLTSHVRFAGRGVFADVDFATTPLADGHTLVWNAAESKFQNQASGGGAATLEELTDTAADVTSSAVIGEVLTCVAPGVWDGQPPLVSTEGSTTTVVGPSARAMAEGLLAEGRAENTLVGVGIANNDATIVGDGCTLIGATVGTAGVLGQVTAVGVNAGNGNQIPLDATVIGSNVLPSGGGTGAVAVGRLAGSLAGGGPQPAATVCLGVGSTVSGSAGLGLAIPPYAITDVAPFTGGVYTTLETTLNGVDYRIPLTPKPSIGVVQLVGGTLAGPVTPSAQPIYWTAEARNNYGIAAWDGGVDGRVITIPEDGVYAFNASILFEDNTPLATETRQMQVIVGVAANGVQDAASGNIAALGHRLQMSGITFFPAGTTLIFYCGATDVPTLSATGCWFQMARLGS